MDNPLSGQNRSEEVDDPVQDLGSESDIQSGIGSENVTSRPEDGPVQNVEGQDTHRNDEPANEDEPSNLTDDTNPPSSTEPSATHTEMMPEESTKSPTTLESKGFKEFREKLEVAKGNTSILSKKIRKLEEEKSGLVEQNKTLEENTQRLRTHIDYLEMQVESANVQLHALNALMENL
ncbi:hypothetical protein AbraIFM66951_002008 [Aspergillus brasiliensis]|uniref:Uncharacterized protein n=1 Tax=Aspergillus brasiliensis TaxID=319629 RepID=A0A9W6DRV0_9EURO|nr:hypothetical protein AbraCBS73388_011772 [Aspergillus brasiliensis]GKZ49444.1 hypothetical protein AbraIFM66951_002008 [Aspergillus brasiliensis]